MGLFSFLFGTAAPAQALGKPVPPESVPADDNYANTFRIAEAMLIVMGDSRHNSADSRYWGFVPEDHVVGKALFIWWSTDKDKTFPASIRWSRVLKGIH